MERPELAKSKLVEELPLACANEQAAVEFLERLRWGDCPCCPRCGSVSVYKMTDRSTGERSGRFLWRCRDCNSQHTVRTGTVYAESLIPLHKWVRAMWETASCKNGVSALELSRKIQVSYKSALFLMHRIRHGVAVDPKPEEKLTGTLEADETYIGARKPRHKGTAKNPINRRGRGTKKQPVAAVLQRGGDVRVKVVPSVNCHNLRQVLRENADPSARLITDEWHAYRKVGPEFSSHETVNHGRREYARGDVHTNSIEGFFARVKRGIGGVYHAVSKEHLQRYMDHFAFLHNTRAMTDGERTVEIMRRVEGRRLMYRDPSQPTPPRPGEQLPPFGEVG